MTRSELNINSEEFDKLTQKMKEYQGDTEGVVNEVLHTEAGPMINESIMGYLPVSGRKWRGKRRGAKSAKPFTQDNENLSVTIRTKNAYHYLYFPDDGSTTRRHHGGQEFMKRGAEKKQSKIIDRIKESLTSKFEEGAK